MERNFHFIKSLLLLAIFSGCSNDDDTAIIPNKDILGKWEITHIGNGENLSPVFEPLSFNEYLTDSILKVYNYEENIYYNQKYWFEDSSLFETYYFVDQIDQDTSTFILEYKFEFRDKNSLRLDLQIPSINRTFIYKRID